MTKNYKHHLRYTRLYRIWRHVKDRCLYPKSHAWNAYGGRGIRICDEWLNIVTFYNWAINNGYQDNLTIDRINHNGNYEPNNCRWITIKEQQRNKRNNHFITYNNETHCIGEWEEITNLPIRNRLSKGWTIEKAFTTPKRNY